MAVRKRKDGYWVVYGRPGFFPDEPTRTEKYFGKGPAGEVAARKYNSELTSPAPEPASGPTFSQLAKAYLLYKKRNQQPTKDIAGRLRATIAPQIGHRIALRLTHADLDRYVDVRRTNKTKKKTVVKNSTIRRELTIIKSILNWAVRCQPPLIPINPIANYKAPSPDDEQIIPPTPEEAQKIYAAASDHLKRAIILAWYLGLRPGAVELLSLTWDNVIMPASSRLGYIRINSAHKGGPEKRDVPIHPGLQAHLKSWQSLDNNTGPLIHYHGNEIKKLHRSWKGAMKRAGITRRLRPYDMRHYFATQALEDGADIGALSEIMGSRPETLRRHYQHVSPKLRQMTIGRIREFPVPHTPDVEDNESL